MDQLIDKVRAKLRDLLDKRALATSDIDELVDAVEERGDSSLTEDETAKLAEARDAVAKIDETIVGLEADLAGYEADLESRQRAEKRAAELDKRSPFAGQISVNEKPTYHKGGPSFFADAFAQRYGHSAEAGDRLASHERELRTLGAERRDAATSAFGALVVPTYLTDEFAANVAAGKPFLNTVRNLPLPDEGMTINIPRGTTATSVAAQTEANALSETDFDETTLAVTVLTHGGQQDVTRQALERGRNIDSIIYADLAEQYAAVVNAAAIVSMAAVVGINAVTYTDADPTVAEAYPKIADAIQSIQSARYAGPDTILMHPRRWGWMLSDVDGNTRPLVVPAAGNPQNAVGVASSSGYGQVVGTLLGLPVVTDAGIATDQGAGTEDTIYVYRSSDIIFMEEDNAPRNVAFEETQGGNLLVKLVVFGYSAFTAGRYPAAISEISGTGLIAPTF